MSWNIISFTFCSRHAVELGLSSLSLINQGEQIYKISKLNESNIKRT